MSEFCPYFTNDGSVGLYSGEFNDIYHSATGALTESYEKFIFPSNINFLLNYKKEIKVLDICYGIGYNSKALINYLLEGSSQNKKSFGKRKNEKFLNVRNYYESIYGDNNMQYNVPVYTDKASKRKPISITSIYVDNDSEQNGIIFTKNVDASKLFRCKLEEISIKVSGILKNITHANCNKSNNNSQNHIYINAVDFDKNLTLVSPFIKTGEKDFEKINKKLPDKKFVKYLNNFQETVKFKIDNAVNFLLLNKILKKYPEILRNNELKRLLKDPKFTPYFDRDMRGIFELYSGFMTNSSCLGKLTACLHNIYYHHVSKSYKNRLKTYLLCDIDFDIQNEDARKIILNDNNTYNLIFLDAFTPSKCPCLWTLEFFKLLFNHLEPDGMLLTYSSSAAVRAAMLEAGFYIGENYNENENKSLGTIAAKNEELIKHPLSEFNLGLLKTRAGIFYRDTDLTALNEEILSARGNEVKLSTRISSTEYKHAKSL